MWPWVAVLNWGKNILQHVTLAPYALLGRQRMRKM